MTRIIHWGNSTITSPPPSLQARQYACYINNCSLSSSFHQGLTEVLLGVAMIWAVFQSQFKVCDGLHDAAFVSVPVNYCTELEFHKFHTFCSYEPQSTIISTNSNGVWLHHWQVNVPRNVSCM